MIKHLLKGVVAGSALLAMVGTAGAAEINVNLYGASAQFQYWTGQAGNFLVAQGCDNVKNATQSGTLDGRDSGWTQGTCGEDIVNIRYTTNASYDGIRAVTNDPAYNPDDCSIIGDRLQPSAADFADHPNVGTVTAHACMDVNIGASDVAATTFQQESHGVEFGPLGGTHIDQSIYYPADLMDPEALNFQVDRPIVVPFGFFANTGVPFDNMTRLMAVSIFNGQVADWNAFDPSLTSQPMTVCLRHAGSGTHATLDAAIMRGDYPLVINEIPNTDILVTLGLAPTIWFNKGSSDEMRCVGHTSAPGGIGYADVDKCIDGCIDPATGQGKYGSVKTMLWQGVNPETGKTVIQNGIHDFWSAQWLYSNETGTVKNWVDLLAAYASSNSTHAYWSPQDDMNWEKTTDFTLPKKKN